MIDEAQSLTSYYPLKSHARPFDADRIASMSMYHWSIILCTIVFLFFQNTLAVFFVFDKEKSVESIVFRNVLALICGLTLAIQVLSARSFKLVTTPLKISWPQRTFLATIQQCFEQVKKTKPTCLTLLISAQDWHALEIPTTQTNCVDNVYDLNYALLEWSAQHNCALDLYLKHQEPCGTSNTVNQDNTWVYSGTLWSESETPPLVPSSLWRWCNMLSYREFVWQTPAERRALSWCILRSTPNFFFLTLLPFMAAALQGIASLDEFLKYMLQLKIDGAYRILVIMSGLCIGYARGQMTYATKVPIANERASMLWRLSEELYHSDKCQSTIDRSSATPNTPGYSFRALVCLMLGLAIATFTVAFYAGLGLFFSSNGLNYTLAFIANPSGQAATDASSTTIYNVKIRPYIDGFSWALCIASALLNGFYNQGWDAMANCWRYATQELKDAGSCKKEKKINYLLCGAFVIDGGSTGITAYKGSADILRTIGIFGGNASALTLLAGGMGIAVGLSQIIFSIELYQRDERNQNKHSLWEIFWDSRVPECVKKLAQQWLGCESNVEYPYKQRSNTQDNSRPLLGGWDEVENNTRPESCCDTIKNFFTL